MIVFERAFSSCQHWAAREISGETFKSEGMME